MVVSNLPTMVSYPTPVTQFSNIQTRLAQSILNENRQGFERPAGVANGCPWLTVTAADFIQKSRTLAMSWVLLGNPNSDPYLATLWLLVGHDAKERDETEGDREPE